MMLFSYSEVDIIAMLVIFYAIFLLIKGTSLPGIPFHM
jgi:hypothetical protein